MKNETLSFFQSLEQLRREKVDLENSLEHEQEVLPFRFLLSFYIRHCLFDGKFKLFQQCFM